MGSTGEDAYATDHRRPRVLVLARAAEPTEVRSGIDRGGTLYAPGGFDSVEVWESDIEQDQIGLQCLCLLNGLSSIRRFDNASQFKFVLEG